jgi:hypothetical protein
MVSRSEDDDELAVSVGSRPDIPPRLFLILLEKASESVRVKLEAAHPHSSEVRAAIAEITSRVRAETLDASPDYAAARASVEALYNAGLLGERELASFAREGWFEETTLSLALLTKLSVELIERALLQRRAATFIILGRAINLSWPTVKAIICMGRRQHSLLSHEVEEHGDRFERLTPTAAQKIVRFYRARTGATPETMHS